MNKPTLFLSAALALAACAPQAKNPQQAGQEAMPKETPGLKRAEVQKQKLARFQELTKAQEETRKDFGIIPMDLVTFCYFKNKDCADKAEEKYEETFEDSERACHEAEIKSETCVADELIRSGKIDEAIKVLEEEAVCDEKIFEICMPKRVEALQIMEDPVFDNERKKWRAIIAQQGTIPLHDLSYHDRVACGNIARILTKENDKLTDEFDDDPTPARYQKVVEGTTKWYKELAKCQDGLAAEGKSNPQVHQLLKKLETYDLTAVPSEERNECRSRDEAHYALRLQGEEVAKAYAQNPTTTLRIEYIKKEIAENTRLDECIRAKGGPMP